MKGEKEPPRPFAYINFILFYFSLKDILNELEVKLLKSINLAYLINRSTPISVKDFPWVTRPITTPIFECENSYNLYCFSMYLVTFSTIDIPYFYYFYSFLYS